MRQIAENAGVDGSVVAGKIRESNDLKFGYNAQTDTLSGVESRRLQSAVIENEALAAGLFEIEIAIIGAVSCIGDCLARSVDIQRKSHALYLGMIDRCDNWFHFRKHAGRGFGHARLVWTDWAPV